MITMQTQENPAATHALHLRRGVLVLGADGATLSASGVALQTEVARRIVSGWHDARRRQRRLFSVEPSGGAEPLVVVVLLACDTTVLVAMQRGSRDALFEFASTVDIAGDILAQLLTNPFEAMNVVDRDGVLRYMSPIHERCLGLPPGEGVGRHVTEVIENSRLHHVAATGKSEIGSLQEIRGVTRIVGRHPIRNGAGAVVGAMGQLMFKGPEQMRAFLGGAMDETAEAICGKREPGQPRCARQSLENLVGESAAMARLKQQIMKVAPLDVPVLLTGESGTGKELVAHAIHALSARRNAAMVAVNAAALPATLVESELFGYEAGAFTGAERKGRKGKIEQADEGSLFFDEVGDMPTEVQVKLLRVLQDGTFQRVGGTELRHARFRLISASNRDFDALIAQGTFRLDFFYRIGGVTIRLPALRERLEDVPLLAQLTLQRFAERNGRTPKILSADAVDFLRTQLWPGNVRQLMHTVERAAIFSDVDTIEPGDFAVDDVGGRIAASTSLREKRDATLPLPPHAPLRVSSAVAHVEEQLIRTAMSRLAGNKKRVAAELGISRSYLYKRLAAMEGPEKNYA
jgi:transcriptional regulator with PAS, ATPase and Fis domain